MESNRETIIMVDDDITNLTVARNNLSEKYSLFTAPSGEKLFELLEVVIPSLILLDVEMPEMGGYEIIKKLKSDEKTKNIPVIFLTAKVDRDSEIIGLSLGAVDYILKPITNELLVKRVDLHIALSREKLIQETNERLTIMLDTSPLCTQIWDKYLNTIDCNEAGIKLYGFKNKREYAMRFLGECSPEYQPDGERSDTKAIRLVSQAFEEGYCKFNWMHQIPDTLEPIPAEIILVRAKYRNDDVVVGYTRDLREQVKLIKKIEERVKMENKMRYFVERAKELSSTLAEITKSPTISAGDLKAAADYIAKEACNVLNVSRISIWGLNKNEDTLINMSCYDKVENDIVVEEDFSLIDREVYKNMLITERLIITSNVHESHEIEGDYNENLCAMLEAPVRLDGKTIGMVCADQDCTEEFPESREWTIEEQSFVSSLSDLMALAISSSERQKARDEAQNASRAKSDFLANMSHEIRTPINVIVGLTELLLEGDNPSVDETDYLQKINTAGNTLVSLINDILDISKIEAGKFTLLPAQYELASLLNDVIMLSIMWSGDKPITFSIDISGEVYAFLSGDDLRVKQILINLLSNAFKYTHKGTVTLSVKCERGEFNDVWLTFSVNDTGIGMRPEDLEKLFSNYNQVDTRANRMIEGTGLGLAIAKGFVELMGGIIVVESEYGKGSTFKFSIRQGYVSGEIIDDKTLDDLRSFKYDDSKSKSERQFSRPDLSWANVLVVDDAPTNLDVAKGLLKKYKMNVDCVLNGHDAIDRMKQGEPVYDAIFMDHMMPGMDGIETAHRIRKIGNDYTEKIPIIALTANAVAGNERLFLDEGFHAFVSKPINVTKLDTVVRRWIMKGDRDSYDTQQESDVSVQNESTTGLTVDDVDIPGVNATLGLSLYEEDMDMYIGILQSFAENTLIEVDKLRDVNEDNIESYTIDIHTMKGISATIGAKSLSVKAKKLERMALNGDISSILKQNDDFIKDSEILVENVRKWLVKNSI
ncbi:MAG: response regulator [Oscillospiraceae bacterium]|nr:response regulator [Oscillospiraceae bacterium]